MKGGCETQNKTRVGPAGAETAVDSLKARGEFTAFWKAQAIPPPPSLTRPNPEQLRARSWLNPDAAK